VISEGLEATYRKLKGALDEALRGSESL